MTKKYERTENDLLVSKKFLKEKDQELNKTKDEFSRFKKVSSMKTETLELKVEEITEELGKRDKELQASKELFDKKDVDLNQLRGEVEYKNTQLASKDMEMESYKNVTDGKIFQLDAKVKELEGKISQLSIHS